MAASGVGVGCASADESASSTPFVSAPSSPDRGQSFSAAGCFYSAPVSPARGGHGIADEYGCELGFDFDFDFLRSPSPAAAAMSSADELFHNGQIRPTRLASFLLRPQVVLPPIKGGVPAASNPPPQPPSEPAPAGVDERGRLRSRSSVHRQYRSLSPFRTHWLSPSSSPAPAAKSVIKAAGKASPSASRSSSSSSTASSDSSSSSRSYCRWGFLKHIFNRSKSDGGERAPLLSSPSPSAAPAPKRSPSPSPAASRGRGRPRRSAHVRLYEARRAEAEEMRRRTFLPYRKGLLLSFLGLGSRGYGDMHGLAAAGKARP